MAKQSFEKKMDRLEEIVDVLDSGDQALEKMLKLYEEGMKLIADSRKMLLDAEQRITVIRRQNEEAMTEAATEEGEGRNGDEG